MKSPLGVRFVAFAFAVLALSASACNTPPGSGKPVVVITSPPNGNQYQEGDDVAVRSSSVDPGGVTRVELAVDGAVVLTYSAPSASPSIPLAQTWKATPGSHTLTVQAFNAAGVASDPIRIAVTVSPAIALANTPAVVATSQIPIGTVVLTAPTATNPPKATSTPTLTVTPCPGAPTIGSFTASSNTINVGDSTMLSWGAVTNATSASIDQGIGAVPMPGTRSVSPTGTTTYVLTATGCGGTTPAQVTVVVNPPKPSTPMVTIMRSQTPLAADKSVALAANCFGGQVTGGGFETTGIFKITYSAPAGGGWLVDATNITTSDGELYTYATCVSNLSGVVVVVPTSPPATLDPYKEGAAEISCPSGTTMVGGGFSASTFQGVTVNQPRNNGWVVQSRNFSKSTDHFTAYVLCYTGAGSSSSTVFKELAAVSVPLSARVDCPAGSISTGGGYFLSAVNVGYDKPDGNGWHTGVDNSSANNALFRSYAVCTHF